MKKKKPQLSPSKKLARKLFFQLSNEFGKKQFNASPWFSFTSFSLFLK
jgi:hypothetical protein